MTRESIKEYLRQIESAGEDSLASRWSPEVLCDLIDMVTDDDLMGMVSQRTCKNCKLNKNADCEVFDTGLSVDDDFGCNEWVKI